MHDRDKQDAGAEETKGSGQPPAEHGGAALNPQPSTSQNIFDDLTIENCPPEQLNALFDSLEKILALEEGKKLTDHVNQILINTLRALAALIKFPKERVEEEVEGEGEDEEKEEEAPGDDSLTPNNLNDKIYDTINSLLTDPNSVLSAGERRSEEEDDNVDTIIKESFSAYKLLCKTWTDASQEILSFYTEKLGSGTTNKDKQIGFKNGYFYKGEHNQEKYHSFIKIIDRLVLFDETYLLRFEEICRNTDDDPEDRLDRIVETAYDIFFEIQENYYKSLNQDLDNKVEMLYTYYFKDSGSEEEEAADEPEQGLEEGIKKHLKKLLLSCPKKNRSIDENDLKPLISDKLSKNLLIHDIEILRDELYQTARHTHEEVKKFKVLTHHLAQDLGYQSQIKDKRTNKTKNPYSHLDVDETKRDDQFRFIENYEKKHYG